MLTMGRIRCFMRGSTGLLWVSAGLVAVTLGLVLAVQWRVDTQATLGPTIALMVYSAWAQALTLMTSGLAFTVMIARSLTDCHEAR